MKVFSGFPSGKMPLTPVPDLFFTDLLPAIDNINELKVTLHLIWRLNQQRGYLRYVSYRELASDRLLLSGLGSAVAAPEMSLRDGLERAVARGTLLAATVRDESGAEQVFYLLNSDKGRHALQQWQAGELQLVAKVAPEARAEPAESNIFALYEQNIGLLQPMIVDALREAESLYPAAWIEDAIREAVTRNKRSWRYIQRILERWAAQGRGDQRDRQDDRQRYAEGKYAEYLKGRRTEE